ncbi:MAG: DUF3793 family protein [Peptoniphilus harei]|uniref:DUF3793 domain-containing protein n=1 Tax=Peptoniphilus gorbachii TaxID=411567 RepID=A0A6N3CCK6_9FIRM|nr:DUF3793 family protein [Peptoniphilus harei]MBS6721026.1 DUF3793 family protein [Peptoniphilus harei]MDU1023450.1 DUF3793 family protein [Peptoniphilus harei]MDU3010580.1 DUF3793 family protein [Peptoniphilus harei]MDU5467977.1 DUF3793 family protein [Peptoniphilus harei]
MIKNSIFIEFFEQIKNFKDFEYLYALIKSTVAPTLKDLKLATMMNLKNGNRALKDLWENNKTLIGDSLGLDFFELKKGENFVLVYFFKKDKLDKKLSTSKVSEFLNLMGYKDCRQVYDYLNLLKNRFNDSCPDEIGVFLGYPLKDVIDFKDRDKKTCKCTGYWKCFNDEKSSRKAFEKFDETKIIVMRSILESY